MKNIDCLYIDKCFDNNWFYKRYYYSGSNCRYFTFQLALNLLYQKHENPVIIETGCQRQEEDLGAGMSTSIFAEYISRNGGSLISVDLVPIHLFRAEQCISKWPNIDKKLVVSDSIQFLGNYIGRCDLLYLDSYDYPYGEILNQYGGRTDINNAIKIVDSMNPEELIKKHANVILPCQEHCLNEFKAIEKQLSRKSIILIDDNQLAGGGKPRLLKEYLAQQGWICLLDYQQTLWVKSI